MCTPKKGYGNKENKGEETINCQIMSDGDLIRLVVSIEERDFECKVGYCPHARPNLDLWWIDRQEEMRDWLSAQNHEDLITPVFECVRRMMTPLRFIISSIGGSQPSAQDNTPSSFQWAYGTKRAERGNIVIEATNGKDTVTLDYQTVTDKREKAIVVHASIRMGDKQAVVRSDFSYKSDAKMDTVGIWTQAQKALHAQACEVAGIPSEPASSSFDRAMKIVWAGVKDAMAEKQERKSKQKDDADGGLFDVDAI